MSDRPLCNFDKTCPALAEPGSDVCPVHRWAREHPTEYRRALQDAKHPGLVRCPDCDGTGTELCEYCAGDGETVCECRSCGDVHERPCVVCHGDGTQPCPGCDGKQYLTPAEAERLK